MRSMVRNYKKQKTGSREQENGRTGFTLVEVIFAVVILSIVGITSFQFITLSMRMSVKLQELSQLYFDAQDSMETKRNELTILLDEIVKLEKENKTNTKEYKDKIGKLAEYNQINQKLFNQNLVVYTYQERVEDAANQYMTVIGGVVKRPKREYPVPKIDLVEIVAEGMDDDSDRVEWDGSTPLTIKVKTLTYNSENIDYKPTPSGKIKPEFYHWYVSSVDYDSDEPPGFDDNYTLLTEYGNDKTSITIDPTKYTGEDLEKYKAKFAGKSIICAVVPLSKNGKMGVRVPSNELIITD